MTTLGKNPGTPSLLWPTIGTIVFVLVVPGSVVVYVPFLLSRWRLRAPFFGWEATRWLGLLLFTGGVPIFVDFIVRFVREGRGTPAPVAPTRHLVVGGCFRYVRNPGYIAVLALLLGQALFFGSTAVLLYALGVGLAFHAFVVLYEEPTLRRQFGAEYEAYCRHVSRWIPRLRRPQHADSQIARDDATRSPKLPR
jgi:protein-S-isoprenylcysteine O-methyltransferase Ste14